MKDNEAFSGNHYCRYMSGNTRQPREELPDHLLHLAMGAVINGSHPDMIENMTAAFVPGGIEAQEKRGQLQQAALQTLPRDGSWDKRPELEAMGFVFPEDDDRSDPLFIYVRFPDGWKKEPTEHSMWSDLVDDKGRKRGAIFFKAAFYDRSAHMSLTKRLGAGYRYGDGDGNMDRIVRITDALELVEPQEETFAAPDWRADRVKAEKQEKKIDAAVAKRCAWLNGNYPDWRNPTAYWD